MDILAGNFLIELRKEQGDPAGFSGNTSQKASKNMCGCSADFDTETLRGL